MRTFETLAVSLDGCTNETTYAPTLSCSDWLLPTAPAERQYEMHYPCMSDKIRQISDHSACSQGPRGAACGQNFTDQVLQEWRLVVSMGHELMRRLGFVERDMVPTDAERRRWRRIGWVFGATGVLVVVVGRVFITGADGTVPHAFGWVILVLGFALLGRGVAMATASRPNR